MARIWQVKRRVESSAGPAPDPRVAAFLRRRFLANDPDALADLAEALIATPDQTPALAACLGQPGAPAAAVVTGSLDDAWPVELQRQFAQDLPAPFHLLHGLGHSPAAQAPAATARVLDRIWSGAPGTPASGQPDTASGPVQVLVGGAGVTGRGGGYTPDMALHATLQCDRLAPRTARRVVCEFLADQDLARLTDDAALLTSELVTNAVRHASGPIHVDAYVRHSLVRLEVADDAPDSGPAPRTAGLNAENGRGMELVEKLADRWGWRTVGTRKVVWLELAI
jgi:anti-sigma regulatory factor (Ser/Thr protein kinase)